MESIDISRAKGESLGLDLRETDQLSSLIEEERLSSGAWVLYGGYLEERSIYAGATQFQGEESRDTHLGIDFWAAKETAVYAPFGGVIHSLQDNSAFHDYGPTIILEHQVQGGKVHTLYGHLSRASLALWNTGDEVEEGHLLGWIGAEHENGNWPPHLHFQIIHDMQGMTGDYPGVCSRSKLDHYKENCPDPAPMLGL